MQEIIRNIQDLADMLARIGQPQEDVVTTDATPFQPWLEFEPVNGLTYL